MVKKIWQENCLFRRVRKIALSDGSFIVSVRMRQLGSHFTDLYEILYLSVLRKSVDIDNALLKCDKNMHICVNISQNSS